MDSSRDKIPPLCVGVSPPFSQAPKFGTCFEVVSGIYWLRMPLPFALNHVNLWLLEDEDGWSLVDCGVATEEVKALWGQLFDGFLQGRPIKRVIVSHCHADHLGLAAWLTERHGGQLWVSEGEYRAASTIQVEAPGWRRKDSESFLRRCGLPEEQINASAYEPSDYRWMVPDLPAKYGRLGHGMEFEVKGRRWHVLSLCVSRAANRFGSMKNGDNDYGSIARE